MAYEALARKYRPRTFDEVVGQDPIVRTLQNAIRERRIHHAYVFSGVRGVGKTTIARIFAKALNCEMGPTPTPCLVCDPCREIAAGRDLDVIEMDAASRTGVDDVRDLIDTTRYAPARDRYKVFIIDEFHMLSKPAFNALLKTLEEPPPRIVFLMATTELHKVLPTVLSRTLQFDFRKVGLSDIVGQLERVAAKEGVEATRACLEMLARAADGSVRDAESLLDQAIAFCGTTLKEDDVRSLLGLVPEQTVEAFLTAAADRDAGALIRMISAALAEGLDLRVFHAGLIEGVRRLLLVKTLDHPSEILGLEPEDEARLRDLAGRFRTEDLLQLFSVLAGLEAPLKYSDQPRYLFEAAAIKMAAIADLVPLEELIARLEGTAPGRGPGPPAAGVGTSRGAGTRGSTRGGAADERPASSAPKGPSPRRSRSESDGDGSVGGADGSEDPAGARGSRNDGLESGRSSGSASADSALGGRDAAPLDEPAPDQRPDPAGGMPGIEATPDERIVRFMDRLRSKRETLAMLIEDAARVFFEQQTLVIVFDGSQAFARKSVEQAANLATLGDAAREAEGKEVRLEIRRSADPPAPRVTESILEREPEEPPSDPRALRAPQARAESDSGPDETSGRPFPSPESSPAPEGEAAGARQQRLHALALEDPAVRTVMDRFGGRIVQIKEVS